MFNRNRDDLPTLRITSLSTDADEDDLRDMFGRYGRIARANVVRDRETGESKGFAFVSFESRADGEKAMKALDGRGQSQAVAENSARGSLIDIFDRFHQDTTTLSCLSAGHCPENLVNSRGSALRALIPAIDHLRSSVSRLGLAPYGLCVQ